MPHLNLQIWRKMPANADLYKFMQIMWGFQRYLHCLYKILSMLYVVICCWLPKIMKIPELQLNPFLQSLKNSSTAKNVVVKWFLLFWLLLIKIDKNYSIKIEIEIEIDFFPGFHWFCIILIFLGVVCGAHTIMYHKFVENSIINLIICNNIVDNCNVRVLFAIIRSN